MKELAIWGALAAIACGGPTTVPTKPAAPPPPASPSGTTAPTAAGASTPSSPFKVIGEVAVDNQLFAASERGFVLSQFGVELELVGDEILQDPLLKRGLPAEPFMISVEAIAGRWPDALWLSTTEPSGRSGYSTAWGWDGKSWSRKQRTTEGHFINGVQPWTSGRMLALKQAGMAFEASFLLLSGDPHVTLPEFSKTKQSEPFAMCMTNLRIDAWRALPSGEVVALGMRCDTGDDMPLAVERWAAGAKNSTLTTLPETLPSGDVKSVEWSSTTLGALSASDIFVASLKETTTNPGNDQRWLKSDYFAHFDGKSWQVLPAPIPEGVSQMWVESDGVLFASNRKDELWSRSVTGEWAHVPWPELPADAADVSKFKLESLWPRGPGDVWAIVSTLSNEYGHRYLLHTRPAPHAMPTEEARAEKQREYQLPGPPVDSCATPFVLLYTLGRKSPADYDYPATREALKGHGEFAELQFIEFERDGRKFFGARVPDFKLGKRLAQLVQDKVPGSTPQLVCHDPPRTRQLDIDLKSGKLRH